MKTIILTAVLTAITSMAQADADQNNVDGKFITGINKDGNYETSQRAVIIADEGSKYGIGDIIFKANETTSGIRYNGNTYIQVEDKVIKIDESNGTATSERFDNNHNVDITTFR